ncbi:hypothetical protein GA0061102_1002280 [Rhizobium miluonense]|uniref:Uncharacterized protein n=1 Tax=Rhizobium miluonense TaxID=411945 RepID=A0A1C3UB71_9HYPH|nr:hypothetical protein GA0061102_1002280 [Rhizobium miluonense]
MAASHDATEVTSRDCCSSALESLRRRQFVAEKRILGDFRRCTFTFDLVQATAALARVGPVGMCNADVIFRL